MPERQLVSHDDLKERLSEGRIFTMQIKAKLLDFFKKVALGSGSTLEVIADKKGEKYPARKRFTNKLELGTDGTPKFYEWEVSTGQVRKGNIAIAIENSKGEPGFLKFWLQVLAQTKQASVKV